MQTSKVVAALEIRRVPFQTLVDEGWALFKKHCEELTEEPFEPHLERYQRGDERGVLICLGAYVEESLIGYSISGIFRHGHYNQIHVTNDSLYIHPDFRRGIGLSLIRATEKHATDMGTDCMIWCAMAGSELDLILSKRRCCEHLTNNYKRNLNG